MKQAVCTLIFCFLPLLLFSQPVKKGTSEFKASASSVQTVELTRNDLMQPVLARTPSNEFYDNSLQKTFTENSGLAFLSSAILPGSGQMVNKNWIRGGIYAALEVTTIYMMIDFNNRGERGQRRYEQFADQNWSVTQYAQWLISYHDVNGIDNPELENLRNSLGDAEPAFDPDVDWQNVNIDLLRKVERNTPFIRSDAQQNRDTNFSHILPAYGSQQYYELISKYFQFQSGWSDYNTNQFFIEPGGGNASSFFFRGAALAEEFNDDFRLSKNLRILLFANHVISAFDSFFTFQLKQNRVKATTSASPTRLVTLNYNF